MLINSRRQYSHFGPKYFLVIKLVLPVFNTYDPVISMIQKEKKDYIYANCIHKRNKMNALVSGAIGIGLIETILFFSITFYALKIIEWISWMVFIFAMYFSVEYFVVGNDRKISSSLLTIKFSVAMVRNRGVWLTTNVYTFYIDLFIRVWWNRYTHLPCDTGSNGISEQIFSHKSYHSKIRLNVWTWRRMVLNNLYATSDRLRNLLNQSNQLRFRLMNHSLIYRLVSKYSIFFISALFQPF